MFKIGQVVVTRNSGVCHIIDKQIMNFGSFQKECYILVPKYLENDNSTKIYIPCDNSEKLMRNLLSKNEIDNIISMMPNLDSSWLSDPKIRKQKFEEITKEGNVILMVQTLKALHFQNEKLKANKKTLSMIDREFLIKFETTLYQEFSVALNIDISDVEEYIKQKLD